MDVRHQRDVDLFFDLAQRLSGFHGRDRAADDLTAGRFQPEDLLHRCFHIFCLCVGHGLYRDRICPADLHAADIDHFRFFP